MMEVPFMFYPGIHNGLVVMLQVVGRAVRRMGWAVVRLFVLVGGCGGGRAASNVACHVGRWLLGVGGRPGGCGGSIRGGRVGGSGGCGSAAVLVLVWVRGCVEMT